MSARSLFVRTALLALTACLLVRPSRADDKPSFARWEKDIAAFEKQDQDRPPPKNAVLFVGSSSIRRWDLAKSFPDLPTINRGFGGSQLADSVHFAPRIVVKYEPRVVIVYAGDNDLAAGKKPEQVAADFQEFVKVVRQGLPKTPILYLSIKPSLARWRLIDQIRKTNALIKDACKEEDNVRFIDVGTPLLGPDGKPQPDLFAKDGLHPNEKAYEIWASILKPYLK